MSNSAAILHTANEAIPDFAHRLIKLYPALASLSPDEQQRLFAQGRLVHWTAGSLLFAEQQPCCGFPLVLDGSIRVVKHAPNGRELLLYRVAAGDTCIITSSCLLGKSRYNACGEAESDLTLFFLSEQCFHELLQHHRPMRDFVFSLFAERISDLMQLVEAVAFARLDQRLARRLLASPVDTINVTHQQLADELGSVREIISRLLKGFAEQNWVQLQRERITLCNRKALALLSESAAGSH